LAFLNQGLSLVLVNEATGRRETYSADDGIVSFVRHLNRGAAPLDPIPFFVQRSIGWTHIEIALQFTHGSAKRVLAFANHVHMDEGGSHLDGFRAALARVLDSHARDSGMTGATAPVLTAEDVGEGLTAVISVMLLHPRFEGPDRTRLGNAEVEDQVAAVLSEALGPYLDRRPADTRTIVERSLAAARRREADRGH